MHDDGGFGGDVGVCLFGQAEVWIAQLSLEDDDLRVIGVSRCRQAREALLNKGFVDAFVGGVRTGAPDKAVDLGSLVGVPV